MTDNVLVDTSIWIEYFQIPDSPVTAQVTRLLREQQAVYAGIIALELIRGARSEKELSVLDTLFQSVKKIVERETTPFEAGKIGYRLARKGVTIGTVDLLISQLAIENGLALYTQDRHFHAVARSFPLKLYRIEAR